MKEDVIPYEPASVLETLPGNFPTAKFEDPTNFEQIAHPFAQALEHVDSTILTVDALWRDLFALTGTTRTFYSADSVRAAWLDTQAIHHARNFKFISDTGKVVRLDENTAWVDVSFSFETGGTPALQCRAILSLIPVDGQWKIWLLRTILEELKGHGPTDALMPVAEGTSKWTETLTERNTNGHVINGDDSSQNFDCVVVGAGQAGLSVAGYLQALGVSYLVVEKNDQAGDSWRNRYDSTKLHTVREYSHLPFGRTYTDPLPQFLSKDHLAEGHKAWVQKYGIDKKIWFSTVLESGGWDEDAQVWTLNIRRRGESKTLTTRHVVLAIGPGGQIPLTPEFPGRERFKGTILHSVDYKNPKSWVGKSGIVVGTANTAHDVAEDMVEAGLASTVMVQRRRTYVLPAHYLNNVASKSFNVDIPTIEADRDQQSMPNVLGRLLFQKLLNGQAEKDQERFDALESAGFKVERYGDLMWHIAVRLGGHYMDVGCSEKISKGLIKMKSDARMTHYTPDGLGFSDGTEVPADVIVFCTGFLGDNRTEVQRLFGTTVAARVKDFWGLDEEGEVVGAFRDSGHPGLWFTGGAIAHARYLSRFIALQIKADLLGTRLPVYTGQRLELLTTAIATTKKL